MTAIAIDSRGALRRPIVEIDLGGIDAEVSPRAVALWGAAVPTLEIEAVHGCARAVASHRLWLRRQAVRRPAPGETWSYLDHFDLVDDELARMRAEGFGGSLTACQCHACIFCHPRRCRACGGLTADPCTIPPAS